MNSILPRCLNVANLFAAASIRHLMDENVNPSASDHHQIRHRIPAGGGGQTAVRKNNQRYPVIEVDGAVDTIECSGKSCRSCAGELIADCVALCCCPCAVVSILTLAFFKVPWMMGRKCLGLGKKKKKKKKIKKKNKLKREICEEIDHDSGWGEMEMEMDRDRDGNLRKDEGIMGIMTFEDARHEAEKVWLELYQVGHLGFGRVSFTGNNGTQSIGRGNSGN